MAKTLNALGDVAFSQGDHDEARRRWNEALALARGDSGADARQTEAFVTANLGDLAFEEGDLDGARDLLERAIATLRPRGDRWALAIVQRYLAKVLAAQEGEAEREVRLLAGAAAIRGAAGTPLGDHQRSQLSRRLEPASAALGRDALALAAEDVAGGRAMTFDQVLDYAAAWADQRSRGST